MKEVLHLYLGCEIIDFAQCHGTLSGIHGEYGPEVAYGTSEEPEYPGIENIKLILRRLSDMSEEEKLTIYGMGFTHNKSGLQILHPGKWPTFKPSQFRYLLSIGVDLFNLIDSGQAIDKKTLK